MIKRTIEVSREAVHLSVKQRQLWLTPKSPPDGAAHRRKKDGSGHAPANGPSSNGASERRPEPLAIIPCEDVGLLLVDQPAVTYSHAALTALLDHDAAVVLCGRNHLPAGLLLPIGEHSQVVWRIRDQITATKPALKRIWKQIVCAKIRAQAANLPPLTTSRSKLLSLARGVRSGDPENVEAQAARVYWSAWRSGLTRVDMPPGAAGAATGFRRDPDGPAPNNLLNYGYAVVRAAVARAIVAAGLLPAIGVKHCNRSNAFCLADDLVEPLRPMVDAVVAELVCGGELELSPVSKRALLELLAADTCVGTTAGPLMVGLHRYVAGFHRCLTGEADELECPILVNGSSVDGAEDAPEE